MESEMSQNKVQFQRGMSLEAFLAEYGTEEQCIQSLFKMRFPKGYECGECGRKEYKIERKGRMLSCSYCYYRTFLTAGTIFENTKLPLKKWFLSMYLLTKDKQGISALQLMRDIDVCYETAWSVKQKLMVVMAERIQEKKLEDEAVADDLYIGGKLPGGKCGRGSENKIPVVMAVSLTVDGKPDQMNLRVVSGFSGEALKDWAEKNLARGLHLYTDGLACFTAVKDAGIHHHPTVMSHDPKQQDQGCFQWINTIMGNVKTALSGTYHHMSEKYLSRYLAEFEYRFNRRYDLKQLFPRLLYIATHTLPCPESLLTLSSQSR
jgi:DNA-directed RNA polymerase subunit RPC12/RpoP